MESHDAVSRPEPVRSLTWPPTAHDADKQPAVSSTCAGSTSAAAHGKPAVINLEDEFEHDPGSLFLSQDQMYKFDEWDDDSDSDADQVEWDAGITDFALFDDDRRRAQERNEPLSSRWNDMLARQASALRRAVERASETQDPPHVTNLRSRSANDVPSLTPDDSPDLRDDLDADSYHSSSTARPDVPDYVTITMTPSQCSKDEAVEDDEDLPLSFYVARRQIRSKANRKLQRPGLRHSRTMSGHVHVWKRPSMYTVGEEVEPDEQTER